MSHHRIWKFRPAKGGETVFAAAYAPGGDWALLFDKAPNYLGTTLLQPSRAGGWWLTIDRWADEASFDRFTDAFGDEYRALDAKLEGIAGQEVFVGTFED